MRSDPLQHTASFGHAPAQWHSQGESAVHAIAWLRSHRWYGEAASGIAMFIQLALLLSMAAMSGVMLGLVF